MDAARCKECKYFIKQHEVCRLEILPASRVAVCPLDREKQIANAFLKSLNYKAKDKNSAEN